MLHPLKLGVAGGILWGACMAICTILAVLTGYSQGFLELMSTIYLGYHVSWVGVIVGAIYGFLDGFIGLYLLAWLYNKLPIE